MARHRRSPSGRHRRSRQRQPRNGADLVPSLLRTEGRIVTATYHPSWEYRDWPHPGYVCRGCDSPLTYDEAMSHRRCSPQLSGPSGSTAPDHESHPWESVGTERAGGEAAPNVLPGDAPDGRTHPSLLSPTVDPVCCCSCPGKGGESGLVPSGHRAVSVGDTTFPSARSLVGDPNRQRAEDEDGTGTVEGAPVPVSFLDLIPRLREAFPDGLPPLARPGRHLRLGEASR